MKKLRKKKVYIIFGIGLFFITIGLAFGRYIYNDIRDFYLGTKSFYFNSDKLTTNRAIYQLNEWSGVDEYSFVINLNNSKNNLIHASSDIEYEISYVCSSNSNCSLSKDGGILYSDMLVDQVTAVISPVGVLTNGDTVWMEITAKSIYPYKKTLSARFILQVGIPGISYTIDDVSNRPYFNLMVTNSTDYYLVKESFGIYEVDQRIDYQTYLGLSEDDQSKCALPLITLTFDPSVVILDMTNTVFLRAEKYTTKEIEGYSYVNSISFRMPLTSSEVVKFYKANANYDYTYPIVNNSSIVMFEYSQ